MRIALGNQERSFGVSFVALSRVRRVQDLLIDYQDLTLDRLAMIKMPADMVAYERLTERHDARSIQNHLDDRFVVLNLS